MRTNSTLAKPTIARIVSIILTAVIALLAVAGYDVTIIQPRTATSPPITWTDSRAVGDTNLTNLVTTGDVAVGGNLTAATIKAGGTPVVVQTGALVGNRIVCGSTTITGTGVIPTGLATPWYVLYSDAQNVTGDGARLSHTNASATVTIKAWNAIQTPAASATGMPVDWCVIGTP